MEGVRNGERPCTTCGGPRDHTRKHPKFGVIANPRCRACHSIKNADWEYATPQRAKWARHRRRMWYWAHRESEKVRYRNYYVQNRERLLAYNKAYRHKLNTEGIA